MNLAGKLVTAAIYRILRIACKVDASEFDKIPLKGSYIIAMNHTNFLEVPMIYTHLLPRKVIGIAKKENRNGGFMKWLVNTWQGISVDREGYSISTFRQSKKVLKKGCFLVIAPEGTRNRNGKLQKGKSGVVTIALHSKVPIIPVVHFGGELIGKNLKSLRRTKFIFKVGKPFMLDPAGNVNHDKRKYFTDQLMYRLAELLPEKYRGIYHDLDNLKQDEIKYVF